MQFLLLAWCDKRRILLLKTEDRHGWNRDGQTDFRCQIEPGKRSTGERRRIIADSVCQIARMASTLGS